MTIDAMKVCSTKLHVLVLKFYTKSSCCRLDDRKLIRNELCGSLAELCCPKYYPAFLKAIEFREE